MTADRTRISIDDLYDVIIRTAKDKTLLVPASDPLLGPYTRFLRVDSAQVAEHCAGGYRCITQDELSEMIGEPEDFTADWKHSD